jgi:hypothetical protein
MSDDKPKLCFDKDYKIRILDPAKAAHAEDLNKECGGFIESIDNFICHVIAQMMSLFLSEISSFNSKINGLVEVLEQHAKKIDDQKLRVGKDESLFWG